MPQSINKAAGDLYVDKVVDAAIAIANREGHDAVTIRRLAESLRVAPMSIYRYVESKGDLLDKMAAAMMDRYELPVVASEDWGDHVFEIFRAFHDLLIANPPLVRLLATRRVISVGVTRMLEASLTHLRSAGLNDEECVETHVALYSYTLGSVDFKLRRQDPDRYPGEDAAVEMQLVEFSQARNFPIVAELAGQLSLVGRSKVFEFGLNLMIEGLRARARALG